MGTSVVGGGRGGIGAAGDKKVAALAAAGMGDDEDFEDSEIESPRPQGVADTVWKVKSPFYQVYLSISVVSHVFSSF